MFADPATVAGLPQARVTVLLVDDDDLLRRLMGRLLQEAGYGVVEASDGAQALSLLAGDCGPIDIVITDVVMPGVDGRELGRRLADQYPALPVIYLSGHEAWHRGAPSASVPFLRKPFPPDALLAKVEETLRLRQGPVV